MSWASVNWLGKERNLLNLAFKFCQVRPELSYARKELFNFGVVNLWSWEVHCGCCACKMISSTPGLSPLDATALAPPVRQPQISVNISKCTLGIKTVCLRSTGLELITAHSWSKPFLSFFFLNNVFRFSHSMHTSLQNYFVIQSLSTL